VEDSIINITLKEDGTMQTAVDIKTSNKYPFREDFERGNTHGFDTVSGYRGIPLAIKQCPTVPASTPKYFYGEQAGLIHLAKGDSCCIMTKESFITGTETGLPYDQSVFIEIDYLTNNIFEVGIISTLNGRTNFHPVVVVGSQKNPQWSKIYVDISNAVTAQLYEKADNFKIFIRATLEEGNEEANIYLDNIRLVFTGKD
jgi:hypothetical protein